MAGYSLVSDGCGRVETSRKRCYSTETGLIPRQSLCAEQWRKELATSDQKHALSLTQRKFPGPGKGSGRRVPIQSKNSMPGLPIANARLVGQALAFLKLCSQSW